MPSRTSPRPRRSLPKLPQPCGLVPGHEADSEEPQFDDWALDEPARAFPQDVSWLDPEDDDEAQPEPGDFWIDTDQIRED